MMDGARRWSRPVVPLAPLDCASPGEDRPGHREGGALGARRDGCAMKCGLHKPRNTASEYRESARFISRLMEQEGIFYWQDMRGRHPLGVGDANGATRDPGSPNCRSGREATAASAPRRRSSACGRQMTCRPIRDALASLEARRADDARRAADDDPRAHDSPGPPQVRPDGRTMARCRSSGGGDFHLRRGAGGWPARGRGAGEDRRGRAAGRVGPRACTTEDYSHWSSRKGHRTPRRPFTERVVCIPKGVPSGPSGHAEAFVHGPRPAM